MYKVLIIINEYNKHIIRFITNLKRENPNAVIDFLTTQECGELPTDFVCYVNNVYKYSQYPSNALVVGIGASCFSVATIQKVKEMLKSKCRYDIVNIHYPQWNYYYCIDQIKQLSNTILLSPWGSDVYRIKSWEKSILKNLYSSASSISGVPNRFTRDFCNMFNISFQKVVNLNIGSDMVDRIIQQRDVLPIEKAKERLNLKDCYVITCGYNNQPSQRHKAIIKAISSIRKELPDNLHLVFPVTYGGSKAYTDEVKDLVESEGLRATFFEKYLF